MQMRFVLGVIPVDWKYTPQNIEAINLFIGVFTSRYRDRAESIDLRRHVFADKEQVLGVDVVTGDSNLMIEAHRWVRGAKLEGIEASVGPALDSRPATIVRARWVGLYASVEGIDAAQYKLACEKCGRMDWDAPPDPFPVTAAILRKPKTEIFEVDNGVVILTQRIHEVFKKHVGGDFIEGSVSVEGNPRAGAAFRWIRPTRKIGDAASWYWESPCAACGRPTQRVRRTDEFPTSACLLKHFGEPAWNLALVGEHTFDNRMWSPPSKKVSGFTSVAMSGGFFAVLYNEKAGGLHWPADTPFHSVKAGEFPLEEERRFAGLYVGAKDRVMKKKVS